jgi:hypothetical protein
MFPDEKKRVRYIEGLQSRARAALKKADQKNLLKKGGRERVKELSHHEDSRD